MSSNVLSILGGVTLAAAVGSGISVFSESPSDDVNSESSELARSGKNGSSGETASLTFVRQRSVQSRDHDNSMATRMRENSSTADIIKPGKSISITISNVPATDQNQISGIYSVSEMGLINMPFIGAVQAAGVRESELAKDLQSRYRTQEIYNQPTVAVSATGCRLTCGLGVTVGGQVSRPGQVPFAKDMTLWSAIQAAGGATAFGSLRRVTLFRDGKATEHNMETVEGRSICLESNDTIEVPERVVFGR